MNDFLEIIGIGISVSLIFGVILGFIAFMRYLSYKETITLAKQGLLKSQRRRGRRVSRTRRFGIVVSAIGMALTCGLFTIGFDSNTLLGPWLLGGLIPLSIGGALLLIDWLNKQDETPIASVRIEEDEPIPPHKMN